jgi:hypothetical protein
VGAYQCKNQAPELSLKNRKVVLPPLTVCRIDRWSKYEQQKRTRLDVTSSWVDVVERGGEELQNDVEVVPVHCLLLESLPTGQMVKAYNGTGDFHLLES